MKFKTLKAENTYSYKKFHFDFNHRGITLILGKNLDRQNTSNGAGKSGTLKILYFALWGKDLNGEPLDTIAHLDTKEGVLVELEFEDRGHEFKIVRYRDRKDREVETGVDFYINGTLFNGENTADTQKIIENRLKISAKLFLSAVMTAQNANNHFLTANDTDKKNLFSELLDLMVYSKAFDLTKQEISSLEEKMKELSQKIDNFIERIKERKTELESLQKQEDGFEDEKILQIVALDKKKALINKEILILNNSISDLPALNDKEVDLQKEVEALKKDKLDFEELIKTESSHQQKSKEFGSEITRLNTQKSSIDGKIKDYKNELTKLKRRKDYPSQLEKSIDDLRDSTNKTKEISGNITDREKSVVLTLVSSAEQVCGQFDSTNENRIKELENLIELNNQEIAKFLEEKKAVEEKSSKVDVKLKKIKEVKDEISVMGKKIDSLHEQIKQIQLKKATLSNISINIEEKQKQLSDIDNQILEGKSRVNPYKPLIKTVEDKMAELNHFLDQHRKVYAAHEDELRYLSFWKGAFSPLGIRSFIFDEVIDLLNQKVQANLNDLFEGALSVVFESESKNNKGVASNKINTKIYLNGKERTFGSLSGGEQQRAILAVNLALTEIAEAYSGSVMNIKFLDEPFNGIDSGGQIQSFKLFSRLAQNKDGFYIISHDQSFQELCPNVIYILMKNSFSQIVSRTDFDRADSATKNLNELQEESW